MNNKRKFSKGEVSLLLIIASISVITIIVYVVKFRSHGLSKDPSDFGTFGDYIGGILGSLISLISIILLYRTYLSQLDITESQENRANLQQFENTFFELLRNQRTIIMSCKGEFTDRRNLAAEKVILCDYQYIDRIGEELKLQMYNFEYESDLLEQQNINLIRIIINDYYVETFSKHEKQLSHYFRHLYHILKYIDQSSIENKKKYVDLVQAQMSNSELYISFYNGISIYGRKKMLKLMNRYSFLENLKDNDQIMIKHRALFYKETKFKNYMLDSRNIIFVGGIHGVGKGRLCDRIIDQFNSITHLSASNLLNWVDSKEKKVDEVDNTQNRLIENLKKSVSPDDKYLLDGHFCLLKKDSTIQKIPMDTFREINPLMLMIITEDISVISKRLEDRDGKIYDSELLKNLQEEEILYAKEVANELGIDLLEYDKENILETFSRIQNVFQL